MKITCKRLTPGAKNSRRDTVHSLHNTGRSSVLPTENYTLFLNHHSKSHTDKQISCHDRYGIWKCGFKCFSIGGFFTYFVFSISQSISFIYPLHFITLAYRTMYSTTIFTIHQDNFQQKLHYCKNMCYTFSSRVLHEKEL